MPSLTTATAAPGVFRLFHLANRVSTFDSRDGSAVAADWGRACGDPKHRAARTRTANDSVAPKRPTDGMVLMVRSSRETGAVIRNRLGVWTFGCSGSSRTL